MRTHVLFLALATGLLGCTGDGGTKTTSSATIPPGGETPQDLYRNLKSLQSDSPATDLIAFYPHSTRKGRGELIKAMVMVAGVRSIPRDGDLEGPLRKELDAIFVRHGVPTLPKATDVELADVKKAEEERTKRLADYDKGLAFMRDLLAYAEKHGGKKEEARLRMTGDLADLEMKGDTATGIATFTGGKKDLKKKLVFKRVDGRWLWQR